VRVAETPESPWLSTMRVWFLSGRLRTLRWVRRDLAPVLVIALRASGGSGAHAERARQVVLLILFAQLLAAAEHDGPPHAAQRAPRQMRARRPRRPQMESLSGRRPRG
jgi:hypothetical protein